MKTKGSLEKQYIILSQIQTYKKAIKELSDEQLSAKTDEFKARLKEGATLDEILPEAYAVICEADFRVLGKFPYNVQILAGIALHQGYLTEMNTGEGKTLVATLPLYLNALTGKSAILLTTNEYLAIRDLEEMGQVYQFMKLTCAAGVSEDTTKPLTFEDKQKIYACDIVYTTHSALGFDYLFNNLVTSAEERFLREFNYVIIDEADSVLLDAAQTPLVISGAPRVQSNLYELADFFVSTLREDADYEKEENKVWLTEEGIEKAEDFFKIDNFYAEKYFEINRHVNLALRAHTQFEKGKDYMLSEDGEVCLLDGSSGRMMKGVKLRGGQHQALETKEKVKISQENRSVASITFQNFFLLFPHMSGMSGTISDAKEELKNVYGKDVLIIPPRKGLQRVDQPDLFFKNEVDQIDAAISRALEIHKTGQPVLIVVSAITETEIVSRLLIDENIPHNVLNASNASWEADIIKEAGQKNAVTVATNMAGRGTDIKLGEGVYDLGGLAVIGIGRMINTREERQARGRAGRQGDPGSSCFFVALTDQIVQDNGPKNLDRYSEKNHFISKNRMARIINKAQRVGEEMAVLSRQKALDYDIVMQTQREIMYETRNELIDGDSLDRKSLLYSARELVREELSRHKNLDRAELTRYLLDNISYQFDNDFPENLEDKLEVEKYIMKKIILEFMNQKDRLNNDEELINEFIRKVALKAVDDAWVEQVDYLQQLTSAVSGRSSAQRNPLYEYQKEALDSFHKMEDTIKRNIMRYILLSNVSTDKEGKLQYVLP